MEKIIEHFSSSDNMSICYAYFIDISPDLEQGS